MNKTKKILIVVDYQNDFVSVNGALAVSGAESIAPSIQKEINNPKYTDVIYTMDTHMPADYPSSEEAEIFPDIHCEFNTPGWDLFEIKARSDIFTDFNCFEKPIDVQRDNEFVFVKDKFSVWEGNSNYKAWFTDRYDTDVEITIVGVATNYCVFLNAIGYKEIGYDNVRVIEDCVKGIENFPDGSADPSFEVNMSKMKNQDIEFISSEDADFEDFVVAAGNVMTPSKERVFEAIDRVRSYVRDYVKDSGLKSLVMGISGGLDSAVVAALCQEEYIGVPLIGISIPLSSSNTHKEMAEWVGNEYCTAFQEINSWEEKKFAAQITAHELVDEALKQVDIVAEMAGFNPAEFDTKVTQGNVKARLRMITLYDLARKTNGMVLSTDNYSELWTGFFTLHGDHNDLGVIQYVEKYWEERPIAYALGIRADIIEQDPSDGLSVTENDTDEAQLGITYRELGPVIFGSEGRLPDDIQAQYEQIKNVPRVAAILKRNKALQFKINWPHFIEREEIGFPDQF